MDPRRRAIVVDFAIALGAMGLGAVATPGGVVSTPRLAVGVAILVGLGSTTVVATLYLAEQSDALAVIEANSPTSLLVVAGVTLAVALALVLGRLVVPWPSGPLLSGMGAGLASYRAVYGLYAPLPESRLAQAGGGWRRGGGP